MSAEIKCTLCNGTGAFARDKCTRCNGTKMMWKAASVVLCVHPETKYVLAVRRGPGDWCLPGGKHEENETPHEAALRECDEETGIFINCMKECAVAHDGGRPVHLFVAFSWGGELTDSPEGIAEWVHRSMLTQPTCTRREMYRKLLDGIEWGS